MKLQTWDLNMWYSHVGSKILSKPVFLRLKRWGYDAEGKSGDAWSTIPAVWVMTHCALSTQTQGLLQRCSRRCQVLPLHPAQARQLQRGPEMSVVCTDWAVKPKQEEIWNSDVSVKTNRKQDAAIMQIQWSKFWSQLWPSKSNISAGKMHSVVH